MTTDDLARLRSLAEAATPGPWQPLVHGTASQRDAAGRAYEAVMAVRAPDNPEIQFTDLAWVDQGTEGPHIALIGNGPNGPENAHYIAALDPQIVLALLDAAALGLAWNRVEAALPEGWVLAEVRIHDDRSEWGAEAANDTGEGPYRAMGYGPTPTAALLALAERLEARA